MAARVSESAGDRKQMSFPMQSMTQPVPLTRANLVELQNSDSPRPSSVGSTHSTHSSVSLTTKGAKGLYDICVGEELKIAVGIALKRFTLSEEQKELEFPSSLTATERAYIHRLCQAQGFKSKSKGKGANRYLTVSKKDGSQTLQAAACFSFVRNSRHQIHNLIQKFPLTKKERQDLQPRVERGQYNEGLSRDLSKTTTGRLNNGVAQVPPAKGTSELTAFRQSLPIFSLREDIIKAINDYKVTMISGETGSGKTTQVPQMILDDSHSRNKPCRIFCTQPRRLSALSVAERVAAERAEKIGQTVGYQIRLESRVSPKTLLTFCTNGVLLRTLMGGDGALATVTHVIVDEIHERDRFSDFLLIALREMLPKYRNLKVVLMSAALNIELFTKYFNDCPVVHVPGRLFDVQEYYLEDVLKLTGYTNKDMEKYQKELNKIVNQEKQLDSWCKQKVSKESELARAEIKNHTAKTETEDKESLKSDAEEGVEKEEMKSWLIEEMDDLLNRAWLTGEEEVFHQLFHLILNENVSVDYQHSGTSATPLMVAVGRGFLGAVEQLLNLGANVNVRASNDWTAVDWARKFERTDIVDLLEGHQAMSEGSRHDETVLVKQSATLSVADKELLKAYHHSFDDEKVDLDLILSLLYKLHSGSQEGAVLIFLPGYDDIVGLRDKILEDKRFADSNRYILYILHSAMQSTDQKRVFRNPAPGVRKIILSTNLAETSITINDVVFVIDSGKVKEKSFDALTSVSMLKVHWISRASALQRKGRAGRCRPGLCYHLFSKIRYDHLQDYQDPEILRSPLQELCLHTKLLAPTNCPIADFLALAPQPPASLITRNAVHLLKQIDSLDAFEDLTELGHHLADLPVEPRYAKMIIYSVVLKCLDPVLTIACALAYRQPFVLPAHSYQKRGAAMAKRKFSAGTSSDHMALLRAFQGWQKAKTEGWEKSFCDKNCISAATMEMIVGMRTQMLGQLRASGFVRARGGGDIRDLNTNSENWAVVKAALCAGMYPNIMRVDREHTQLITVKESRVRFHTSSVLAASPNLPDCNKHSQSVSRLQTDWLIYEEMTRHHKFAQVKCCTLVSPMTIVIFAGPAKLPMDAIREAESGTHMGQGDGLVEMTSDSEGEEREDSKKISLRLDDWLQFKVDPEAANLAIQLRQKWQSLFIKRMRAPNKPWSPVDDDVIRTVVGVLTNEEQALGLQQPAGIGQRPKPMSAESFVSSGGSKQGSYDSEHGDDCTDIQETHYKQHTPTRGRPFKFQVTSPRRRGDFGRFGRGDHTKGSDNYSYRSVGSNPGSANTSEANSLRGSAASSPSTSPQPSSPSKFTDPGATSTHPCRFFVMKSNSHKNLDISNQKAIWATTTANEKRLEKAYKDGKTVYVIFSVQGSGNFQGYAKMTSAVGTDRSRDFSAPGLGGNFSVQWNKRANLPFQYCQHLQNPWNENRKIQVSRDGQEIEPTVGEALLKLWDVSHQQRSPQYGKGMGRAVRGDSRHSSQPKPGSKGSTQSGKMGQGLEPGSYHDNKGQWSRSGYGQHYQKSGQTGFDGHSGGNTGFSQPINIGSMPNPFNPLLVGQGQVSPGSSMFSSSQSPHQNISPVMILQRGARPSSHPGSTSSSSASSINSQPNYYHHQTSQK